MIPCTPEYHFLGGVFSKVLLVQTSTYYTAALLCVVVVVAVVLLFLVCVLLARVGVLGHRRGTALCHACEIPSTGTDIALLLLSKTWLAAD